MGFVAPWFLGGLALVGVPVFVHLLRKHITEPRPVSSLMFFERGKQSSTRHRKLKYLLLLALRTALVLLVVLAFANPFVYRASADANTRTLLVVLDNSFSMRAGTRFADAKRQALATLAGKPHDERAQIVALSGQVELLTQPISDDAQLHTALESIQPGDAEGNFGELGRAVRALTEAVHGPIDLHLFSDMQRSATPANFGDMVFPATVKLTLHNVASGTAPPNWTVEDVNAPAQLADPKDPQESKVEAVIAGFNTPAARKDVSLVIDGKVTATKRVEVPASGRVRVTFSPLDVAYGFNRCEVRVDGGDGLAADDAAVFAVRRSDPERVLFVHANADSRSPVYFGAALQAAAPSSYALQAVSAEQAADLDPSKYAFVVLSDALSLPSIFEHALSAYVSRGGNVLIALSTSAARRVRIPLWGSETKDAHFYGRDGHAATMGQVDFSHPALEQNEPGRDNGGWAPVKVDYAAAVDAGSARVAMRLTDGTPLLMDKQMGEGHVLLLASGLDNLTNDLPLHPVFVAFVDRVSRYLSGSDRLSGSRTVDAYLELRAGAEPGSANGGVEVIDPDGKRPLSLGEARTAQSVRLEKAGFYQIHFANGRDAVIGVNANRRESDLAAMPDDVQQLWTGSSANASGNPAAATGANEAKQTVSLWWYVMLLALIAAMTETLLSSRYLGTLREEA